jgi:DNA-binding transcriptional regulator YhcF (GntR family)
LCHFFKCHNRFDVRFWITKNSEIPLRDQLVRQVLLGILSEDLPPGHKLPSVRALARRHRIHANTVSAAYHDLLAQGWLESRHGSGLYVRTARGSNAQLDDLLRSVLQAAKAEGHSPDEVLLRLEQLIRPRTYERILIAEPEAAMREILAAEIGEHLSAPIDAMGQVDQPKENTLVVALPTRATKIARAMPLRVRSVHGSLEGRTKPAPQVVIFIVSRSAEIRYGTRAMMIAVGVDPLSLCEIDAAGNGWQERLGPGAYVITDIVAARELPAGCDAQIYRVIADSSIEELKQLFL